MSVILSKPLKREIRIGKAPFIVTVSPEGFKLTEKGRRKGMEFAWKDLTSGEAALATALNASLAHLPRNTETAPPPRRVRRRAKSPR